MVFVTFDSYVIVWTYFSVLSFSLSFQISVVTRDEVGAYKPYLWEQSVFVKGPMFRDWLLTKVSNEDIVLTLVILKITQNWYLLGRLNLCFISLGKIVNGERASYSAPKFARMQERTRSQMLEDLVANLHNHAETGQIPKPYR